MNDIISVHNGRGCDLYAVLCLLTAGLPVLLTAQEEAVLCGSAILAAAASGLKVNESIN